METQSTLRALFEHNDWAWTKLLDLAQPVDDERLDRSFDLGIGSLRRTLHHLWRVERHWLDSWLERFDPETCPPPDGMSVARLRELHLETARARNAFLDRGGEAGESRRITIRSGGDERSLPLGDTMLQLCGHGTHHRSQVLNMLRHLGVEPPRLGYIHWFTGSGA